MNLKNIASGAGNLAAAAQRKAELTTLETITLPALYLKIGNWIAGHEKLPPDLAGRRDEIRAIEAQQAAAQNKPIEPAVGISSLAKQLASKTAQAANDAATSLRVRSAYISLGRYASAKYGDKAVPADVLATFRETLARVAELRPGSAVKPVAPAPTPRPSSPPATVTAPAVAVIPSRKQSPTRVSTSRRGKSLAVRFFLLVAVVAAIVTGGVIASQSRYVRDRVWMQETAADAQLRVDGQKPTSEERQDPKTVAELLEAGRLDDATKLAEHQLEQMQKRDAQGSPLWDAMSEVATLYVAQKKYAPAIPLYENALKAYESVDVINSEETAQCLQGLARAYEGLDKYSKAEQMLDRLLAVSDALYGTQSPRVAHCLNALAGLYEKQGRFAEAEQTIQRGLAIVAQAQGTDNSDTAVFTGNLGGIYETQKKYDKAEECYLRAIDIFETIAGPKHPFTAMGLNNLARLYKKQGLYKKAEPLMARALVICEDSQGQDHPDTQAWRKFLAEVREKIADK